MNKKYKLFPVYMSIKYKENYGNPGFKNSAKIYLFNIQYYR